MGMVAQWLVSLFKSQLELFRVEFACSFRVPYMHGFSPGTPTSSLRQMDCYGNLEPNMVTFWDK